MPVTHSPGNPSTPPPAQHQAQQQQHRRRATCNICQEPYNEEMIYCDGVCRKWFHLLCVGLSSSQADELGRWVCEDCREGYVKRVEVLCKEVVTLSEVAQGTIDAKKRRTVIRAAMEKFNKAKEKYISLTGDFVDQKGDPLPTPRIEEPQETAAVEENESEGRSTTSKSTSMSTATRMKMQLLEKQRKLLKEQRLNLQLEHDVLKQQQDLVDQASIYDLNFEADESNRVGEVTDAVNNITLNPQAREFEPSFSQRQIAARKIYRALPTFTGELEEWPVFKRMFEQSTKECGYSNEENLMRLQQSLKGRARNEVASQLCEPSCIPDIMESLMLAFGQPIVILNAQIEKISKFPPVRGDKLESIIQFSTAVTNMNAIMKASSLESQYDNPLLLKELLKKLNNYLKMKWASYAYERNVSGVLAFGSWLKLEAKKVYSILPSFERAEKQPSKKESRINVHVVNDSFHKCIVCSSKCESVETCVVFNNLPSASRWEKVKELKLCRQCLTVHRMKYPFNCKKAVKCNVAGCSRKHHPLMHLEVNSQSNLPVVESIQNSHTRPDDEFQFQYLPVILQHGNKKQQVMAFLDGGSSGTRIEEDVAEQLGLTGPKVILNLKWTANVSRQEESTKVSVHISGVYEGAKKYVIPEAHTIRELNLPKQTLCYEKLANKYNHLRGLPVCSYRSTQPKIMIGISDWHLAVPIKTRLAGDKDPVATKCKLGWSVFGSKRTSEYESVNYHVEEHREPDDEDLHESMKKFFCIETLGVRVPKDDLSSQEDRRATSIMQITTKLVGQKYETGLLWRYDDVDLPDSFPMAKYRLKTLNRRLEKNPQLRIEMQNQIAAYLNKGYIRKLGQRELEKQHKHVWYLPLFPVINPNKPGRVRIVWDAAAKVNGVSLNSFLLKGPDQLSSLLGILFRFRENSVAICGDISEMFHQVKLIEEDQQACRFLWNDHQEKPSVYVTQVMTFGATCSPSSAQYVKNLNAKRFESDYPRAVKAIVDNHYVDDLLDSAATKDEAIELAKQIKKIHSAGGFHIRKWKSNSHEVMLALESSHEVTELVNLNKEAEQTTEKVLGMWWDTQLDSFTFSLKLNKGSKSVLNGQHKPTKREVLRILMSVFDPLGLINHFTSYLKVLLQQIWCSKVDWDDEIENEQHDHWLKWLQQLHEVESIHIPRCYTTKPSIWNEESIQIHIFVDASKDTSAAVAYMRIQTEYKVSCTLLASKTKVAPIKLTSIPRLELIAALIGARLACSIRQSLSNPITKIFYWSDSVTVLRWLRSDAKAKKGQFVAFRIAEIQELSNFGNWRYVPSDLNVADDATKWKKGPSLNMNDRWFKGPEFLLSDEIEWPDDISLQPNPDAEILEAVHHICEPAIKFENFSSWLKILRLTAFVHRGIQVIIKRKIEIILFSKFLMSYEYKRAEISLFKIIQSQCFENKIKCLKQYGNLYSNRNDGKKRFSNEIISLKPYLDDDGVLRSMSRIDKTDCVSKPTKRPIILSQNHYGTKLLVTDYHERFRHINHETVVNEVRKKFYIPRLRQLLKRIRTSCNRCKILRAKPEYPEMSELPAVRLTPYTPPFTYTAVDYGGPFEVANGRKLEKRWICLFTCLVVRAVHIEIAYSCSTDSFILCYRNFLSRRGPVRNIFSDRGTNFVGAEKILRKDLKQIESQTIASKFVSAELEWYFHPPGSPHMNGCVERLIKSVKTALYAVSDITTHKPNDELFRSFLMEVEDMINSRPLTYLPLDSEESESLTPNHFLRQFAGGSTPTPLEDINENVKLHKTNALMSQLYAKHYWKRWVQEYLPTLTRRDKWTQHAKPLQEGDIVLVIDERYSRKSWPKGKILKVYMSKDNQVRSATVKTMDGIYERPAVKLAKLDLDEDVHLSEALDQCTGEENVIKISN